MAPCRVIFASTHAWVAESVAPFAIVGAVFGAVIPYLQISGEAQRRLKEVGRGLPYVIDLMALAMSAGLDFPGAVRQVVEKSSSPDDPLIDDFRNAHARADPDGVHVPPPVRARPGRHGA